MNSLRTASLTDSDNIARIYNQYVMLENFTMEQSKWASRDVDRMLGGLNKREFFIVGKVAIDQDLIDSVESFQSQLVEVDGWASLKTYSNREGYRTTGECSVYIDPQKRGFGLGSDLMNEVYRRARLLEYHHLVAKIFTENTASVNFHLRHGFEMVGVQKEVGFTRGRWKDVTILQKLLS